jgi:phage tail P2-like protein
MSSLLPYNATPQERALEGATARIGDIPVPVRDVYNAATCPVQLLPWLAWAFSIDTWSADWTEGQKRGAVANALNVQKHKGTIGALVSAMSGLGFDIAITEWFQTMPAGSPYTFNIDVTVDQVGIPDSHEYDTMINVANSAKNVRSHLGGVTIHAKTAGEIYGGGNVIMGETLTISAHA